MFRNFIVTAVRIAFKQRLTTILNILGMALGIAVSIILIMHVRYEFSYDKHIPDINRVYRIINQDLSVNSRDWATTSTQIFNEITDFIPEIEEAVRIKPIGNTTFSYENEIGELLSFEETGGFYVDSTIFDVFSISLIKGKRTNFNIDMNSIIITKSMAERYFGDDDPIGKQLRTTNSLFTVRGVIPDCPKNSHLDYTFFLPYKLFKKNLLNVGLQDLYYSKGWAGLYNYVKLKKNSNIDYVNKRMSDFTVHYYTPVYDNPDDILKHEILKLQAVKDIHLHSNLEEELTVNGNITYIYVFIISIFFILIIVATNYVNIATSLALKRTKEIGIKKINGSSSFLIKVQIILESILTAIVGGILAVLLIDIILPFYNQLADQHFALVDLFKTVNFVYFMIIVFGLGILSGVYPAFFITRFNPIYALKGLKNPTSKTNNFRKGLLIFQFVVSVFMIFATVGIYNQMNYFQNKNLGFDKENLVSFKTTGVIRDFIFNNPQSFKNEINSLPIVKNITYCSDIPGERLSVEALYFKDHDSDAPNPSLRFIRVDKEYIKTMGLKLIKGPGFTDDFPLTSKFILSKRAVEVLGLKDPIDKVASSVFGGEGIIRGVIDDYHFASLHQTIEPIVLEYNMNKDILRGSMIYNVIIRITPGNIKENLEILDNKIKELAPNAVINYTFVDDYLNSLYISETKMSNLFKSFTLFTIFIACLGLFGITAYNAELMTKEIGIRKVLGASNMSLIKHLTYKFMVFIFISIVIALPLAYWFIHNWLQNFAYHVTLSVSTWLIAIILSILIAYLTILYHALRIAHKKPVDVLKYE